MLCGKAKSKLMRYGLLAEIDLLFIVVKKSKALDSYAESFAAACNIFTTKEIFRLPHFID